MPNRPDAEPSPYSSFQAALAREAALYADAVGSSTYSDDLRTALSLYQEAERFEVGDLVQWKPHLRAAEFPDYRAPAIIVEVFKDVTPKKREKNGKEPIDVAIGYLDGSGDLRMLATNSRRLTRWSR